MPRPEKVQAVADIRDRIDGAKAVFLAEYAGLSVQDQQTLRRSLKQSGAEFRVVKMTLARLAAADLDIDSLDDLLLGPTGLTFADDDAVSAAKALREFAKEHDVFTIKGGLLGKEFLTPERINELAEIESREVLLSKIVGAMQAPLINLAGLMSAIPGGLATAMLQLIDKMPEATDGAGDESGDGAEIAEVPDEEDAAASSSDESPVDTEPSDSAGADAGADAGAGASADADASSDGNEKSVIPAKKTNDDEPADQAEEE